MMFSENVTLPAQLLAEGFSAHAVMWAREQNAPESALSLLKNVAYEVSMATSEGHVCTMLDEIAASHSHLNAQEMQQQLMSSGIVGTPESPGAMPLILDKEGKIYLHRYFDYEWRLAKRLIAGKANGSTIDAHLQSQLNSLFPSSQTQNSVDWQKIAVALALQNKLTIISGGPGTGKTTTVVNLLACLLEQNPDCRIALAAPTGKAAARMQEAIRQRAAHLSAALQARLPAESYTVHRLLGTTPKSGQFRHHAGNLLPIDALVVDEASMLDIALAARLFDAVPPEARIILLGDKDQLSAVEAGAVFSELSADPTLTQECITHLAELTGTPQALISPSAPLKATALHDSVIWFKENYRFSKASDIGILAAAISDGKVDDAIACLNSETDSSLSWANDGSRTPLESSMHQMYAGYEKYRQALQSDMANKAAVFDAFDHFRALCAMREGPRGSQEINRLINQYFRQALNHDLDNKDGYSEWYPGRPVIVLRNDYLLQLFNGDIGITLPDEDNNLMVYFPDGDNGFRSIAPIRLPEHETAFAMTVHKSQGSEFNNVLLLLPAQHNRVTTRELLYTGITRAREHVAIVGSEDTIRRAIHSPTQRRSGLIRRMEEAKASG